MSNLLPYVLVNILPNILLKILSASLLESLPDTLNNATTPVRYGFPDLLRRIFLQKVIACDRDFGLVGPGAAEFSLRPDKNCSRIGIDKQLRQF